VAAWAFLVAMSVLKGVLLEYGPAVIAEGIAMGVGALGLIMMVIKHVGSEQRFQHLGQPGREARCRPVHIPQWRWCER
jgi:hypothetical protein